MENLDQIKKTVSLVVYGLISLICATIIVRVLFMLIGASTDSAFVVFIYNTSEAFVATFRYIYPSININGGQSALEIYSLIALIFYGTLGYLLSTSIRSAINIDASKIVVNIIDSAFKFAEVLLITRFVFKLSGASLDSTFVKAIYEISAVIYEPFQSILPGIQIPSLGIIFETSTLIAIIAIIIFDLASEGILAHIKKDMATNKPKHKDNEAQSATHHSTSDNWQNQQPQAAPTNITIQIPQQQPQNVPPTQYIDRRTIQVISPDGQISGQPYSGKNNGGEQNPPTYQQLPDSQSREV